jgi:serine/threonine protein kinase
MATGAATTCPECGAELPAGTAVGQCPNCLLALGLVGAEAEPVRQRAAVRSQAAKADNRPKANDLCLDPDPLPLATRFGDYELLEEIGHGGMGVVYKARQKSLDRIVALKLLMFGPHAPPESVKRFRAEAVATAALQHPHIVAIHEVGLCAGQHFLVMDFVEGPSLARLIGNQPLPARRAAGYVRTIAEAIHYAHERGLLHRDLKPSNVLIDANDQPRVTDFGLAKRLEGDSELTVSGQVLGSPNFMPPEQAAGKRGTVSRRSDVYALGAILYHALTGRPPFVGEGLADTVQQVLNVEPVSPRVLNPRLPADLETVCLKCLEKEPAKRYATAQLLAQELGRFLEGKPVLARPVGRLSKAGRWCRRNPHLAGATGAALLSLLLGAGRRDLAMATGGVAANPRHGRRTGGPAKCLCR